MRLLIDNALSPEIAASLAADGYDAVHVSDVGLATSDDHVIFEFASAENRVIVSADTDFGFILASRAETRPSVVLFRGESTREPTRQIHLLKLNLPHLAAALGDGAVVVIEDARIRIRSLPLC